MSDAASSSSAKPPDGAPAVADELRAIREVLSLWDDYRLVAGDRARRITELVKERDAALVARANSDKAARRLRIERDAVTEKLTTARQALGQARQENARLSQLVRRYRTERRVAVSNAAQFRRRLSVRVALGAASRLGPIYRAVRRGLGR